MKLNNNIEEAYCSFAISTLLKIKGFDVSCKTHYELALTSRKDKQDGYSGSFGWKKGEINIQTDYNTNTNLKIYYNDKTWTACSRPTHSVASEWLRVNFGIHLSVSPTFEFNDGRRDFMMLQGYGYWITFAPNDKMDEDKGSYSLENYKTPQEATEAALEYVLNNLI